MSKSPITTERYTKQEKSPRIYCCGCQKNVRPRLTSGEEIYPHRPDLSEIPFWKCDLCGNYVGCHHKTDQPTRPLGCIPTPELMNARKHIHAIMDPLWKTHGFSRKAIYSILSQKIGRKYHTAQIRSIEEARVVYRLIQAIAKGEIVESSP